MNGLDWGLPEELFREIIQYLKISDIFALLKTSKLLNNRLSTNDQLWQQFCSVYSDKYPLLMKMASPPVSQTPKRQGKKLKLPFFAKLNTTETLKLPNSPHKLHFLNVINEARFDTIFLANSIKIATIKPTELKKELLFDMNMFDVITRKGPNYCITLFGDGGVGSKTTSVVFFIQGHFVSDYDPTIENSYRKQTTVDGEACMIDLLDTAGQEEYFSGSHKEWAKHGDGFMFGYSVTSRSSFKNVRDWRSNILSCLDEDPTNWFKFPVVLVGNKIDLVDDREVSTEEGQALADEWGVPFIETSAKRGENIEESYFELVREIKKKSISGVVKRITISSVGVKYVGHVSQGVPHGVGGVVYSKKRFSPLVRRYEGSWVNGRKNGTGQCLLWDSDVLYLGVWKNGRCVRLQNC